MNKLTTPNDAVPAPSTTSPVHKEHIMHEWNDGKKHFHGYETAQEALVDKHTRFPKDLTQFQGKQNEKPST